MISAVLLLGLLAAMFVGFNIGGSSTGVAFGPAVGAKLVSKASAAALMSVFVLLGGWTLGRKVIATMGGDIVPATYFSLEASVVILVFIGLAMLSANVYGVPVSTSMTAVGAIAGLGLATDSLNWEVMGRIVSWWIVTPVIAFWVGAVIGRYFYPYLNQLFALEQTDGPLFTVTHRGRIPVPAFGPNTTLREAIGSILVLTIACYMAFSAGASNVANAVAPLVGSGQLDVNPAILLAAAAISVGSFTIARRTLDTVGGDLTELPLLAALIVAVVSATLTTVLSWLGIPISLALSAIMCIVGLGWGRATRVAAMSDVVRSDDAEMAVSVSALTIDETNREIQRIGEETVEDIQQARNLFDPAATARVISLWIFAPTSSAVASYLFFALFPTFQ